MPKLATQGIKQSVLDYIIDNECVHIHFNRYDVPIDEIKSLEKEIYSKHNQQKIYSVLHLDDYTKLSPELKEYLISEDRSWMVEAEAVLTKSFTRKLLIDLYFQLNLPLVPTKTFTQVDEASRWLQSIRNGLLSRA